MLLFHLRIEQSLLLILIVNIIHWAELSNIFLIVNELLLNEYLLLDYRINVLGNN